jgi:hypothetical protein
MKKILVPIKSKLKPVEVNEEIKKFKYVHKSPYSQTYYDTDDISWEHKAENSLRISDHWNFESHGKIHCQLCNTGEYIENEWILAQYKNGKYHILKNFGEGVDGYIFKSVNKNEVDLIKNLYEIEGIEKTYNWYKNNNVNPLFSREGYLKNIRKLSKYISIERLRKFKSKKPKAKKIIFIEDRYMETVAKIIDIYNKSEDLNKLTQSSEGIQILKKEYNAYELEREKEESIKEIYTLILENDICIDFV